MNNPFEYYASRIKSIRKYSKIHELNQDDNVYDENEMDKLNTFSKFVIANAHEDIAGEPHKLASGLYRDFSERTPHEHEKKAANDMADYHDFMNDFHPILRNNKLNSPALLDFVLQNKQSPNRLRNIDFLGKMFKVLNQEDYEHDRKASELEKTSKKNHGNWYNNQYKNEFNDLIKKRDMYRDDSSKLHFVIQRILGI